MAVTDGNWFAMGSLGDSCSQLGRHRQAVGYFEEAARIKPENAELRYNLGVYYTTLGQHQQAIGSYRESLRIRPENAEARANLGVAIGELGTPR